MRSNSLGRLCLPALLLMPLLAGALETDKDQPIYVEADSADINEGTGISVYQGNVIVTQGSIRLDAEQMTITQVNGETDRIEALGSPVKFQQQAEGQDELIKGRANKAEYKINSEILYMTGDAVLYQGKDTFRSDRIIYDRVQSRVRAGSSANGKQRVRISIQPKKGQKKSK